jgi:hypothetical protein
MLASKSPNAKTQAKDGKGKENEKAAKTRDGSSSTRKKDSSSAPSQDSSSKAVDSLSRGLASLTLSLPPPLSQSGESSTGPRATKVIEDYNSPIQLITRGPDWKKLAPQAKHGMLGIGNMPLNFTNVVSNDWNGRKTEVSEELRREAKAMSVRSAVPAAVSDRNVVRFFPEFLVRNRLLCAQMLGVKQDQLVVMTPAELAAEVDGVCVLWMFYNGYFLTFGRSMVAGGRVVGPRCQAERNCMYFSYSAPTRSLMMPLKDDRFIARRDEAPRGHAFNATAEDSSSPGHTARVKDALGLQPTNKRILNFHNAAPTPSADPALALQRQLATPLYARPGTLASSVGVYTNKSRHIATVPERILDAPGMIDDYYLNLISWSCENVLGVALAASTYTWNAETGSVDHLGTCADGTYVASLDFSNDGTYLGVGVGTGDVEVWDIETGTKLRSMTGHQAQVSVLSWNQHILSSGCVDGSIWHHDVRIARHKVMEMNGHTGEVCGLKWRQDGELIASGGNDNLVNCWEPRLGDVVEGARGQPKWQKTNHTAAVKVRACEEAVRRATHQIHFLGYCLGPVEPKYRRVRRRHG